MEHHSGQHICSVLPPCLRSICCWHRRTCRLSEWGQVFLSPQSVLFVPIAIQTLKTIAPCSLDFLTEVGRQMNAATDNARETSFLFQLISVALQRFNAVLIHEFLSHPTSSRSRTSSHSNMCFSFCINSLEFFTLSQKIILIITIITMTTIVYEIET